jgi:hypothetical protein
MAMSSSCTDLHASGVGFYALALSADGNPIVAFEAAAQTGVVEPTDGIVDGTSQIYVKAYRSVGGWSSKRPPACPASARRSTP